MNASLDEDIHVSIGTPTVFGGERSRSLIVAAALGGTHDPVDLALLGTASRQEDLRHYQQLAYTPPRPALQTEYHPDSPPRFRPGGDDRPR